MGYTVWINDENGEEIIGSETGCTYNLHEILRRSTLGLGLAAFHGMSCDAASLEARLAVYAMLTNASEYRALEPKNGWGTLEDALSLMVHLALWAGENPDGKVVVA